MRSATLRAAGTVALVAGGHQMLTGTAGVRGLSRPAAGAGDRNLDSELRFYASWYAVAGLLMLRASTQPPVDRAVRHLLAGGWAAAGVTRLLSIRAVGRPDKVFVGLAAAELAVAGVLAATQPDD